MSKLLHRLRASDIRHLYTRYVCEEQQNTSFCNLMHGGERVDLGHLITDPKGPVQVRTPFRGQSRHIGDRKLEDTHIHQIAMITLSDVRCGRSDVQTRTPCAGGRVSSPAGGKSPVDLKCPRSLKLMKRRLLDVTCLSCPQQWQCRVVLTTIFQPYSKVTGLGFS